MEIVQYIFLSAIFLSNIVLGLVVLFYNKKSKSNISFFILTLITSSWVLTNLLTGYFQSLLWFKINFSIGAYLPIGALWWGYFFSKEKRSLITILVLSSISTIFAVVLHFDELLISEVKAFFIGRIDGSYGPLFPYYSIYLICATTYLFIYFLLAYRKVKGIDRIQIGYIMMGIFGFGIIPLVFSLLLPLFNIYTLAGLDSFGTTILVGMIAYAILKHRLFDIVVIIRKVTILGILLMIILGIFSLVAFGLPFVFAESLPEDTFQITLVAVAFIVALFFQPLRRAIEEFTDKWFFKGAYKPQEVIDALSEKISSVIDLRVLLDSTAQILLQAFRSEHAVFSVREKIGRMDNDPHPSPLPEGEGIGSESTRGEGKNDSPAFRAYNTEGRHRPMEEYAYDEKHAFTKYFNKYPSDVIIRDELQKDLEDITQIKRRPGTPHQNKFGTGQAQIRRRSGKGKGESVDIHLKQAVLKEMENHDFAIIFPVLSKEELVGIFGLGVKKSGDIYTTQDLNILELYAHQVGVAVENTKLYADLKLFNEKLQLEVEKATQDLRITNSQIALRNKDLGALQKITNLITKTLDLGQITQTIADSIQTELGYIGGIIYFYDKEKKALRPSAITKTPLTQMAIKLLPKSPFEYEINDADNNLNTDAFKSASMKMSNKFSDFVHPPLPKILIDEMQKLLGMKTVVAVPIFVENEAIGLINFGLNKNQGEVTDQELQMMRSLADQMGIVVRNVRLYDAVKSYSGKLEEANEYLKELDQTKSEFISIASHQLRSPMTGIKGYLSMLIDGDFGALDEKKKGIMKQMFENTERLIRLINIFLNVSRIEAGRLHLDKRETHIDEVIKSVITEMSNQAKTKKLELYFDEPKEKIPPFIADFDKLRDVVLNFVDNAIKYTASGKVWVTVGMEVMPKQLASHYADQRGTDTQNNAESASASAFTDVSADKKATADKGVVVRVHDTGMGLDPEDAKKLFDKFSRVKGIAQINPDGSGLGLYIAKKLSEAHNGGVWVESKGKGKGSSFCLWVPIEEKK